MATIAQDRAIGVRSIGQPVVGHDPFNHNPVSGEDRQGMYEGGPGLGYDHFEVVIDDRTRRSIVVPVPDETAVSAAAMAVGCDGVAEGAMAATAHRGDPACRSDGTRSATPGALVH